MEWITKSSPNFPMEATWAYTWNTVQAGFNDLISSKHIVSSICSALQNCSEIQTFYKNTDPLVSALYFTTILISIHYVMSEITKNYSQVGKVINISRYRPKY